MSSLGSAETKRAVCCTGHASTCVTVHAVAILTMQSVLPEDLTAEHNALFILCRYQFTAPYGACAVECMQKRQNLWWQLHHTHLMLVMYAFLPPTCSRARVWSQMSLAFTMPLTWPSTTIGRLRMRSSVMTSRHW